MESQIMSPNSLPLVKIVGVSGSGKSTLVEGLRLAGYNARPVSQEHSAIPYLWQQFDRPAVLIFLYANLEAQQRRRPDVEWKEKDLSIEMHRLSHAKGHSDLRIETSDLEPDAVLRLVLRYLEHTNLSHSSHPLKPVPPTGSAPAKSIE